jgi:hypothetical protein
MAYIVGGPRGSEGCCQLVGNLQLSGFNGCVTSINVSANTEINTQCASPRTGPTVGNVSLTGYASSTVYVGCPSQAGVSVNWIRRYDCENDIVYFIHSGQGSSFISGPLTGITYVSMNQSTGRTYPVISANSSSGPTSLYLETNREDGYGLSYSGDLFNFNTASENDLIISNFGVGSGDMYLQNFSLSASPGTYPTVSYSFLFTISEGGF